MSLHPVLSLAGVLYLEPLSGSLVLILSDSVQVAGSLRSKHSLTVPLWLKDLSSVPSWYLVRVFTSSSHLVVILSPGGHLAKLGDICDYFFDEQVQLKPSWWRLGVPLNILQCTGRPPTKNICTTASVASELRTLVTTALATLFDVCVLIFTFLPRLRSVCVIYVFASLIPTCPAQSRSSGQSSLKVLDEREDKMLPSLVTSERTHRKD